MAAVYLIEDPANAVDAGRMPEAGPRRFIAGRDCSDSLRAALAAQGFCEIAFAPRTREQEEMFLREYVRLTGRLGKMFASRLWWATDTASRNRFTSRLPNTLHDLLRIESALAATEGILAIAGCDPETCDAAAESARAKGWKVVDPSALKRRAGSFVSRVAIAGMIFCQAFRFWLRSVYARFTGRDVRRRLRSMRCARLFKTFVYDRSFGKDGRYQDAFFGSLVDGAASQGDCLVLAYIAGGFRACVRKSYGLTHPAVVPMEYFLNAWDCVKAAAEIVFAATFSAKVPLGFMGSDAAPLVNAVLRRSLNGIQFAHYCHYAACKRLFALVDASLFILTCENNPWERMAVLACRESKPDIPVFGYQHAVVPRSAANMFIAEDERVLAPRPDLILTVGDKPKEIMERYGAYAPGDVAAFCGLRFEYLSAARMSGRCCSRKILVTLEGVKDVKRLVQYVFRTMGEERDFSVVFRTHPVLNWRFFSRECGIDISRFPHFSVSQPGTPLKTDIEQADMVVYWGTTVALEALSMGKPVIHFLMDTPMACDPLFDCPYLKFSARETDRLGDIARSVYGLSDAEFTAQQAEAKKYLARYFLPVTQEKISSFLERGSQRRKYWLSLGVVIPSKNRKDDLLAAVASVVRQDSLPDEIVIVDQSQTDEARPQVEKLIAGLPVKLIYIFDNTLSGLTQAKNRAVTASASEALLFIDDDIILHAGFIAALRRAYRRCPWLMGVGGVVRLPASRQSSIRRALAPVFQTGPFRDVRALLQAGYYRERELVPTWLLSGGLSSLRREVFAEFMFDETLKGASPIEDFDFYARASKRFSFAIATGAVASHNVSLVNRLRLAKVYELKCEGFGYVFRRHIAKGLFSYAAYFWRNAGLLTDAVAGCVSARSFAPLQGTMKGWMTAFKEREHR